ncbi:hypothetical protein GUJ93_ZPchr0006g42920 [Zizania palustris]|uniref:Uncharacterized protein n=1 Tax=Zizania palustris TaxID=103762 RepID=A0A8J5SVY5_ZIZPA|nr:hypothetical protein GUJ93_ZPchr0006g42920 [Zizania palustris]
MPMEMEREMERSRSCAAERTAAYAPAATDLRCYSASYVTNYKPPPPPAAAASYPKVKRATSASSWSRPGSVVQRSGSTKTVSSGAGWGAGPMPGFSLRSYSASYAASYSPFEDAKPAKSGGGGGGVGGAAATWSAANRRSVNLRGYTPSFSALDDTAAGPHIPSKKAPPPPPAYDAGGSGFDDAELQRRKRLVAYKAYDVEGKVKNSFRRSFKWIKGKCSRAVYGL